MAQAQPTTEPGFGRLLRQWRSQRGMSQLDLSVEAGVSSRHLSFVETGRAQASREMVLLLARVLDVPLRDRNDLLVRPATRPSTGPRRSTRRP
jgi:transcriptional regulator with XRE-family HTH domain